MSYRLRLTLLTCIAVAVTLLLAAAVIYGVTRRDAYGQIDGALERQIEVSRALNEVGIGGFRARTQGPPAPGMPGSRINVDGTPRTPGSGGPGGPGGGPGGFGGPGGGPSIMAPQVAPGAAGGFFRELDDEGNEVRRPEPTAAERAERESRPDPTRDAIDRLPADIREEFTRARDTTVPITDEARALARRGGDGVLLETVESNGITYRVITAPITEERTAQIARPINETQASLDRLAIILALVTAGGTLVGLVTALITTRAATAPVHRLTELTEAIRESGDLSQRVSSSGSDDLAQMARSFNAMLEELERSVTRQQRLIDDASHELRTPLASIRTNMDVLLRARSIDEDLAREILGDLSEQVDELTALVRDLVDLASGIEADVHLVDVRLDEVAADAVRRVRGAFPDLTFEVQIEEAVVRGSEERLVRMAQNLVHNAAKFSPERGAVVVTVSAHELVVRDHGPGVPDSEKQKIFERFHRSPETRDTPGSGLGLAIVEEVARTHGATVTVEDARGGGAAFRVVFPPVEPAGQRDQVSPLRQVRRVS